MFRRLTVLTLIAGSCFLMGADTQPKPKSWAEHVVAKIPAELIRTDADDRIDAGKKIAKMTAWWQANSSNQRAEIIGRITTAPDVEADKVAGKVTVFTVTADPIARGEQNFVIFCRVQMPHSELEKVKKLVNGEVVISGIIAKNTATVSHSPQQREYVLPIAMNPKSIKAVDPK